MKDRVRELLTKGEISGLLGLKLEHGHPAPYLFTKDGVDDLDLLVVGNERYGLNKILLKIASKYPEDTFGVMVRGCDERGLVELYKWEQLNPNRVIMVGVACSSELAEECGCQRPYPSEIVVGEEVEGVEDRKRIAEIEDMDQEERLRFWLTNFRKCIKCYGCRNTCPLCFCTECPLEDGYLISTGDVPPESPIFHLTRAVHTAGRCVDCGLCEEACPMDIPLRTLYKKIGEVVGELFGYTPGEDAEGKSPFNILGEEVTLELSDINK